MAVPYLSLPSNASVTASVDRRGEMSSADLVNPDQACDSWEAGRFCWLTDPLHLSQTYGS